MAPGASDGAELNHYRLLGELGAVAYPSERPRSAENDVTVHSLQTLPKHEVARRRDMTLASNGHNKCCAHNTTQIARIKTHTSTVVAHPQTGLILTDEFPVGP